MGIRIDISKWYKVKILNKEHIKHLSSEYRSASLTYFWLLHKSMLGPRYQHKTDSM